VPVPVFKEFGVDVPAIIGVEPGFLQLAKGVDDRFGHLLPAYLLVYVVAHSCIAGFGGIGSPDDLTVSGGWP
jgi:hypothetical protein